MLTNTGTKPARISAQRIKPITSRLDPYLKLYIYDANTKQCIYPKPKPPKTKKPKKGQRPLWPKPSGVCKATGDWSKMPKSFVLQPKRVGKYLVKGAAAARWIPKEKHQIQIRWEISASAPNNLENQLSGYTLRWRAMR